MSKRKLNQVCLDFASVQQELDRIEVSPQEWAEEFDSLPRSASLGMFSLVASDSTYGVQLRQSRLVKDRLKQTMQDEDLDDRSLGILLIALLSVRLPDALRWIDGVQHRKRQNRVLLFLAEAASNFQRTTT
ncbi:MAG TPA: hypothetical protein VJ835_08640 [Fimbriimonadaceae bacterium]|nr:hypothetical protein [Fimbriimonadaceae bacterium]